MAQTKNAIRSQNGLYDSNTGVWTEPGGTVLIEEDLGRVAGYRFSGLVAMVGGQLQQTRVDAATFSLQAIPVPGQTPVEVTLYARGHSQPEAYATNAGPRRIDQQTALSDFLVGSLSITSTGSQTLEFDLDLVKLAAAHNQGPFEWNGTLAFSLHARTQDRSGLEIQQNNATLVVTVETNLFTGIEIPGDFKGIQSRADICPRCGNESLRQTWAYDDFLERMVCGKCGLDPDDPKTHLNSPTRRLLGEDP